MGSAIRCDKGEKRVLKVMKILTIKRESRGTSAVRGRRPRESGKCQIEEGNKETYKKYKNIVEKK